MKTNPELIKLHAAYVAELGISGRDYAGTLTLAHVIEELRKSLYDYRNTIEGPESLGVLLGNIEMAIKDIE